MQSRCALLVVLLIASAGAQDNLIDRVQEVFGSGVQTNSTRDGTGGFGEIVTPEPIVEPTTAPTVLTTGTGGRCTCVPYYLCNPDTNTTRQDGRFDGFGVIDIRFDPRTCQDYLDVCCGEGKQREEPIKPPPTTSQPNRPRGCGVRNVGGLDFTLSGNTNEAGFGEFPWTTALIRIRDEVCLCGGSLIHPSVVMTGNHCVRLVPPKELKVRAGEWDTQTTKERLPFQERTVSQIISHPSYDIKTLANNVALLVLTAPFQLADHINPICLPQQNFLSTSDACYASGWGKDVFGKAGKYSVIMKRVQLPMVPARRCEVALQKTRLGPTFRLDPTFVCAGGIAGIDTCTGDGGAPLVCPVEPAGGNRYVQTGIVSWGIGCLEAHPAVYTHVALFRNWIDNHMNQLNFGSASYTLE
ncbi:phenoloxidase-activating factor 2-like [Phlebotomus argentipes]|uniref:phenoloxidase-activating factor 2-like n=1 Tax=Phlebotomus argentipes TaxID=94469 RepID=UPI00289316CD|nr:phenoloxidase-activating factor 2-like [Phlebotomus argentipes]